MVVLSVGLLSIKLNLYLFIYLHINNYVVRVLKGQSNEILLECFSLCTGVRHYCDPSIYSNMMH